MVPGDRVLSRHEDDVEGAIFEQEVVEVFRRSSWLLRLTIDDRTIDTTPEHPFFVRDRGWTSAGELKAGDQLASLDSRWLTLKCAQVLDCDATVYNVSIQDFHTYFVGEDHWEWAVWSHNACKQYTKAEFDAQKGKVKWVAEKTTANKDALDYQSGAAGSRSGEAPALLYYHAKSGTYRHVKFDGNSAQRGLIDRKFSKSGEIYPFHRDKIRYTAQRQSAALAQNGKQGVWEVVDEKNAMAARKMLLNEGIENISVRVVSPT